MVPSSRISAWRKVLRCGDGLMDFTRDWARTRAFCQESRPMTCHPRGREMRKPMSRPEPQPISTIVRVCFNDKLCSIKSIHSPNTGEGLNINSVPSSSIPRICNFCACDHIELAESSVGISITPSRRHPRNDKSPPMGRPRKYVCGGVTRRKEVPENLGGS